jgi:hypothetical protein
LMPNHLKKFFRGVHGFKGHKVPRLTRQNVFSGVRQLYIYSNSEWGVGYKGKKEDHVWGVGCRKRACSIGWMPHRKDENRWQIFGRSHDLEIDGGREGIVLEIDFQTLNSVLGWMLANNWKWNQGSGAV